MTNQDVVNFVRDWLQQNPTAPVSQVCELLLNKCLASEATTGIGCDNMTAIVVVLRQEHLPK